MMRLTPAQAFLGHLVLVTLSLIFCSPFLWMVSTSLKAPETVQSAHTEFIPRAPFIQKDGKEVRVRPLMIKNGKQEVQLYDGDTLTEKTILVDPKAVHDRIFFNIANYTEAFQWFPFHRYLMNTLIICCICVIGTILSCSLVAYGLACVEWRGREILFWFMFSTMMLPAPSSPCVA